MVHFDGSDELAARVEQEIAKQRRERSFGGTWKTPVSLGLSDQEPLRTSPADVLLNIGVATALFDDSPFADLARHWAQMRYCGTLRNNRAGRLVLSEVGSRVVHHHKVAQSEYLGIGFSLVVVQEVLRRRYPGWTFSPVDVDYALRDGITDVGAVSQHADSRPDYFLVGRRTGGGGGLKLVVLECKGTHQGLGHAVEQLAKACKQVASVEVGGRNPDGMMVATMLQASGIESKVIDPPGDSDLWQGSERDMDDLLGERPGPAPGEFEVRTVGADAAKVSGLEPETAEEPDSEPDPESDSEPVAGVEPEGRSDSEADPPPEGIDFGEQGGSGQGPVRSTVVNVPERLRTWFSKMLANANAASALLFAGASEAATRYLRESGGTTMPMDFHRDESLGSSLRSFELPNGMSILGTRYSTRLPGGRTLEVHKGIEKNLYRDLETGRLAGFMRRAHLVAERRSRSLPRGPRQSVALGNDGTVLWLRVTG
ncbi:MULTISPECIES: hypothetical protein [unclassified Actinopolyspora]|uniref:hypothetical protein n=1 Tax=unclassified Actinopolyspora TaxID=2639451 RepID=UPI0013F62402|nr:MULTISPECIES: hypothetical protein [unclassified Actinopolyspora]NHD16038.1 hypothetical protein [Actinopolyspora sp. BKK2]NHE74748.1 hypothetical protein [Actinopolyspora sp. BKK1]